MFAFNEDHIMIPDLPNEIHAEYDILMNYLMTTNDSTKWKLKKIYNFIDFYNINFTSKIASCKKGCSFCCTLDEISVSKYEADFIKKNVKDLSKAYRMNMATDKKGCSFLVENCCAIYESRPYVCRTYHALGEPSNCIGGKLQAFYGTAPSYSSNILRNLVAYISRLSNNEYKDIRQWFPKS